MSEWKEYVLEEVVDKFIDYRGKTPVKTENGIPLITAKIVKNGRILEPNEFIAESDYKSWMTRGFPELNDLVITTEAPLGEVALIKNKNVALAQRIITLQTKKDLCDSVFLKYYFQSKIGQGILQARASGSTVEGIKSAELKKVEVSLPPLPEQTAIAEILSSLDDKIDLLHRQNKTLEQMAETLFRQWFVEEAEDGWETVKVSDVASINKSSLGKNYSFEEIEYLDTGSITNGHIECFQKILLIDAPSRAQRQVDENDIVYSLVRPIHRHFGLLQEVKPNTIVSTGFCVISCDKITPYFIYILLTQNETVEYLDMVAEGSTSAYPSLKPSDIGAFEFQLPPKSKLDDFAKFAETHWNKIKSNTTQIRTLTKQREILLPELMSGGLILKKNVAEN